MIAFINVDYIWNSRFWMNFALNKHQKLWFLVCATRGYTFCGMRGYGIISQRMIFQWNTCMTTIWYKIQLITFGVFHPKTTVSDVIRGTFKFDNFYFNKYICSHVKLMFVNVFSLFRNYLPSKKSVALHLNNLESPSPRYALYQVLLKFAQWFMRRWKCEKFTTTTTVNGQIILQPSL